MQTGSPSRTAFAAAGHRAAHQFIEDGRIFRDPLAVRILGVDAQKIADYARSQPQSRPMRLFIAARTRFAEDALADAVARGATQLVVLGAGLDTFAYRNPFGDRLRVFEVDHPNTQQWKRDLLVRARIEIPSSLTYAPVDFENQTLADGLAAVGFDQSKRTFFTWLGVVPYLTEHAIASTLHYIANASGGAHVVFDYANPPDSLSVEQRAAHDARAERVAAIGEKWLSYFKSDELRDKLSALGFRSIEDLGPQEISQRYFGVTINVRNGGHIVHAATISPHAKNNPAS